ncbi:hypothetical protein SAY87_002136 [Trapa incisa]|uniref:non-specific serine/threonine protein kinase n=1 Tax=Trapa incisa TaxID=236973 RepID=A0AAN7JWA8_9MYRT|nr:hypothetical protein SAY87_002136 [Trapa incisa]
MDKANRIVFAALLLAAFSFAVLTIAQDQSGFISLDCGQPQNIYTDDVTGITYISDSSLIDTGESKAIMASLKTSSISKQLYYVRSFPDGVKHCYTVSATGGKRYLVRARFMYGNYDSKNQLPEFHLYLGVTFWASIKFKDTSEVIDREIIHVLSSDSIQLCLVKTGFTTPFISAIELRLIWNDVYITKSGSLLSYFRLDLGPETSNIYRYRDDAFDRLWFPVANQPSWQTIKTNLPIDSTDTNNNFLPPSSVMRTAISPSDPTQALNLSWTPSEPKSKFYIYLHFAEVQQLQKNGSRSFNISMNGNSWINEVIVPQYLYTGTILSISPTTASQFNFSIYAVNNSTYPPLLNAIEAYVAIDILEFLTKKEDAYAITNIKSTYGLKLNWQGDPCGPETLLWNGVGCTSDNPNTSSITHLNLSFQGLTGNITTYFSNLKSLQTLDLSYNNLTGQIPDSLAQLSQLKALNLTGNNLTGYIPPELLKRDNSGTIQLHLDGNPHLCKTMECNTDTKKNSSKLPVALGASAGALLIILVALGCYCYAVNRRRLQPQDMSMPNRIKFERGNRQFTYTEVITITNNFKVVVGKGGFGTVYLGQIGNAQVAVKMLSPSSAQGYREFRVEAELLMRVHHKNLTSLIGYCDEVDNLGLIYEYMARGNLRQHLSERNANSLRWDQRIQIAADAAQGLDYLHKGCKPPMIHRDVKSTNILINDHFQAKVSDFGLSRAFPAEGGHLTTTVAGTPGYLDPEYFRTNMLSEKSDVYSFGIVLLEIITCRPVISRGPENTHIIDFVNNMLSGGDISAIIDPGLAGNFNENSAWKIVELAKACVAQESTGRPSMSRVAMELEQCLAGTKTPWSELDSGIDMNSVNLTSAFGPRAR